MGGGELVASYVKFVGVRTGLVRTIVSSGGIIIYKGI